MSLGKLKEIYKDEGIALALGAGISKGAGLPDWSELLQRIARAWLGSEGDKLIDELKKDGFSLPAIAGMLKSSCPKQKNFLNIVRDELYNEFSFYPNGVSETDPTPFTDYIQESRFQTLSAVAGLCAIPDKDNHNFFLRNPKDTCNRKL